MKERENRWRTSSELWEKLKPLAQQMRREPTPAEERLWKRLRHRQISGFKFRRQQPFDRFMVDFYCSETKLVIEVDGSIHDYTPEEDALRQEFRESMGLQIMRFTNDEVFNNLESVLQRVTDFMNNSSSKGK